MKCFLEGSHFSLPTEAAALGAVGGVTLLFIHGMCGSPMQFAGL